MTYNDESNLKKDMEFMFSPLKNKNLFYFLFFALLFRVLLEVSYVNFVSPLYFYSGYKINFSFLNYAISWSIFLMGFLVIRDRMSKVSDYFFVMALLSIVAPITVMYGYDQGRELLPVLVTLITVFFIYYITRIKTLSFKKIPIIKGGMKIVVSTSSMFVLFLVVWYYVSGVTFNLDLAKVYEFRSENSSIAAEGLLTYTNNWTYKIFNITLFALSLLYRKYFLAFLIILIQIYFFAASAHKGVLFLPILIFGIWLYFRKTNSLTVIPLAFCGIIMFTLFTYFLFDDTLASSLFSRRVFFIPAKLTFVYFDFFSSNPHILWSNSILSPIFSYPYDLSLSHVVGRYLGDENMGANNGFISSGFAHAGYLGVFLYATILGILLRFINDITYNLLPLWFAVALSVIPLRNALISSDLFTVMLTHGFIIALIIIFLLRSKKYATN